MKHKQVKILSSVAKVLKIKAMNEDKEILSDISKKISEKKTYITLDPRERTNVLVVDKDNFDLVVKPDLTGEVKFVFRAKGINFKSFDDVKSKMVDLRQDFIQATRNALSIAKRVAN